MSRSPQDSQKTSSLNDYIDGWHATGLLLKRGKSFSGNERNCAFLNCKTSPSEPRFANVSAASGFDFPDDGRGLAVVDWDQDGDLDLWVANRTAPRLRLMRNETPTAKSRFLALRLRGTTCNRDAIGARVEVELSDTQHGNLVQTLQAGDGFLSQSSKWLHFGLGEGRIERVVVRWPGGQSETFTDLVPGGRYVVEQGRGRAVAWDAPPRSIALEPSSQKPHGTVDTSHVLMPVRFPLPVLPYTDFDGSTQRQVESRSRPLLVNLGASWCLPCVAELKEWTERDTDLRAAGLDVLALSVDGRGENETTTPDDARKMMDRIGFPFEAGMATIELLDKIEKVQGVLFDRIPAFAVPLSFLIDRNGQLAAIYRGSVEVERLLRDLAQLDVPPQRRHVLSAPFTGSLANPILNEFDLIRVEHWFANRYPTDALMYLELALKQQGRYRQFGVDRERIDENTVEIHQRTGEILQGLGRRDAAVEHCRKALTIDPEHVGLRLLLGTLLGESGEPEQAIALYQAIMQDNPTQAATMFALGMVYGQTERYEQSAEMFAKVIAIEPQRAEAYINLGKTFEHLGRNPDAIEQYLMALTLDPQQAEMREELRATLFRLGIAQAQAGRNEQSAEIFERFVNARPDDADARFNLATMLELLGRTDQAIYQLTESVRLRPKAFQWHYVLGTLLAGVDRVDEALEAYARARRLKPKWPLPLNGTAWLLATHPDDAVRKVSQAVQLAERAAELTDHRAPEVLDTLAAAYAAAGQFDKAVTTASQAIEQAVDKPELADEIRPRLKLYERETPYRAPVTVQK